MVNEKVLEAIRKIAIKAVERTWDNTTMETSLNAIKNICDSFLEDGVKENDKDK